MRPRRGPDAVAAHEPARSASTTRTRIRDLIRAGNLYLSLQDALALAIENNLDVELQRFTLPTGDTELLRAQGGGTTRGLNYTLLEAPVGRGRTAQPAWSPTAPLPARPPTALRWPPTRWSWACSANRWTTTRMQGTIAQSNGTAVPIYDPALVGQLNWSHQTTPQTNSRSYGTNALVRSGFTANAGIQQGFATGAQAALNFNNQHQSINALNYGLQPFHRLQPGPDGHAAAAARLRPGLNHRFIRIAGNERKITSLLFQQQLIATTYGVIRLYTDFVALYEDEKVKAGNRRAGHQAAFRYRRRRWTKARWRRWS